MASEISSYVYFLSVDNNLNKLLSALEFKVNDPSKQNGTFTLEWLGFWFVVYFRYIENWWPVGLCIIFKYACAVDNKKALFSYHFYEPQNLMEKLPVAVTVSQ